TSGPKTAPPRPSEKQPNKNGGAGWPSRAVVDMRYALWSVLFLLLALMVGLFIVHARRSRASVDGEVHDDRGPLTEASVRFQGAPEAVLTDTEGRFHLPRQSQNSARVTAWKKGYLIAGVAADASPLALHLTRLP